MFDLETPDGASEAYDINENGQIVGVSYTDPYMEERDTFPVLWENGTMIKLETLSTFGYAYLINEQGWIAGDSGNHAVIWFPQDVIKVTIGNVQRGMYGMVSGQSVRKDYPGLNSGPVEVKSTNANPILASLRVIYGGTSYSEMMGLEMLQKVTAHLTEVGKKETPELFLADATLYLELFGIVSVAWQWLVQAIAIVETLRNSPSGGEADFYNGKFFAFRYFFEYELPKMQGLAKRLMHSDGLTVEIKPDYFSD